MTEKDIIRCESVFNEDRSHRYLWKRVWNKEKPLACVIMLNPCMSDNIVMDTTTALVVNNVARLEEYGGVMILNLFSKLTTKLSFKWNSDEDLNEVENNAYLQKAAAEAALVVYAWGRGIGTNKRILHRAEEVVQLLAPYGEKVRVISDGEREGLHPLTPSIRSAWILKAFKGLNEEKAKETKEVKGEEKKESEDKTNDNTSEEA